MPTVTNTLARAQDIWTPGGWFTVNPGETSGDLNLSETQQQELADLGMIVEGVADRPRRGRPPKAGYIVGSGEPEVFQPNETATEIAPTVIED